jgi:hypothetical protein
MQSSGSCKSGVLRGYRLFFFLEVLRLRIKMDSALKPLCGAQHNGFEVITEAQSLVCAHAHCLSIGQA